MANMTADNHKMDGEQAAILQDLCEKTGHPFDDQMSSAKADELIERLSQDVDGTEVPDDR
ncbi:DUF3072 domain-containing protein [Loktanella sp. SALINAS62]|uniref:DUF3072 domain-containing protein n=1 Tax=Loktanella sp. SALINAS62 TaxID=2706124 RepID=UPI001B8ADD0F|nr:DUF3072 domain-containing protein [Loktanella sp. SALINAS62]MBS1303349.1 DUF3072 domain-containing protein [Loktanella sp. SALINAS62]